MKELITTKQIDLSLDKWNSHKLNGVIWIDEHIDRSIDGE